MTKKWEFHVLESQPVLTTAIHAGHMLPEEIADRIAICEEERLREEDPFTELLAGIHDSRIIVSLSRFIVDLNRPLAGAVYQRPEDSWGLKVWKQSPDMETLKYLHAIHDAFYRKLFSAMQNLFRENREVVVLDIHSYNHRRQGPQAGPGEQVENPDINVGTGTMERDRWETIVDSVLEVLSGQKVSGRLLDVRENVKFRGGFFPQWMHRTFPEKACVLSLEFKKIFMDEWTGELHTGPLHDLQEALRRVIRMLNMRLREQ